MVTRRALHGDPPPKRRTLIIDPRPPRSRRGNKLPATSSLAPTRDPIINKARFGFGRQQFQQVRNPPLAVTRPIRKRPTDLPTREEAFTGSISDVIKTSPTNEPASAVTRTKFIAEKTRRRPFKQDAVRPRRRSIQTLPADFPKRKPTRVTVDSPSGRGRTITVSSRSRLARGKKPRGKDTTKLRLKAKLRAVKGKKLGRKRKPRTKTKARGRQVPRKPRTTFGSDFNIFRVGTDPRPIGQRRRIPTRRSPRSIARIRRPPRQPDRSRRGSDFDVLNFFA